MTASVLMEELTWMEYEERIRNGAPLFLVVGATEQHGPHLPLGTDVLQGMGIARAVAELTGGIVAPSLAYGYKSQPKSGGGQTFAGTTSLDGQTLILLVRDLVREFSRHGVRRLVVIDGHYENSMFLSEAIDLALREIQNPDLRILVFRWVDLISDSTVEAIFGEEFPGWALEHAAVVETSVTSAIRPELVHWERLVDDQAERLVPYDIYPTPPDVIPRSGVLSPARKASSTHGQRIVNEIVRSISEVIKSEFQM